MVTVLETLEQRTIPKNNPKVVPVDSFSILCFPPRKEECKKSFPIKYTLFRSEGTTVCRSGHFN